MSLTRDSLAKFTADAVAMIAGVVAGVITARSLGPAGKGTYATLAFLIDIAASAGTLGLGEATVVLIGRRGLATQQVLSATLATALVSASVAGVAFIIVANLVHSFAASLAVAAAGAATVLLVAVANVLGGALNAHDRIFVTSIGLVVMSVTTMIAMWAVVAIADAGVTGAVVAGTIGAGGGAAFLAASARRMALSLRPRLNRPVMRGAARFGSTIQAALLLRFTTARLDLFIVYWLLTPEDAGHYSVVLASALLVGTVCGAVSYATFPRLSRLADQDARLLLVRSIRLSAAGTAAVAVGLAASSPITIPLLFGSEFSPAIRPTFVAVVAGLLVGLQWSMARGMAAQGKPKAMFLAYATSTATMLAFDMVLIPRFGLVGAAIAASIGGAAGLVVCLRSQGGPDRIHVAEIVPRPSDVRHLARTLWRVRPKAVRVSGVPRSKRPTSGRGCLGR